MISRRLIRVKAFKELFSKVSIDNFNVENAQSEVVLSIEKTIELYNMFLILPAYMVKFADERLLTLSKMFHPDAKQIEKSETFKRNPYSQFIESNREFTDYCSSHGISWTPYYDQLKPLYKSILGSDIFDKYCQIDSPSLADAANLFKEIYSTQIEDYKPLEEALEDACIWWGDDIGYVLSQIVNSIDGFVKNGMIPIYKSHQEDIAFAKALVSGVLTNYDEYVEMAQAEMKHWDLSRIVSSDILLIVMGIAEAIKFEDIGLKTTINEYIEISKYYSTPKSKSFVNGVLNKILRVLQDTNQLNKSPKGLTGRLTD